MRIDYANASPDAIRAIYALQGYSVHKSSIEAGLRHLMTLRASQINGCAFCLEMHSRELRAVGESAIRIDCLSAWHETSLYTPREQAALRWTEAVTNVMDGHVPDEVFEAVKKEFSDTEIVDLTMIVATINVWNRFSIAFRPEPGSMGK